MTVSRKTAEAIVVLCLWADSRPVCITAAGGVGGVRKTLWGLFCGRNK